jgi:tRNA-specific 2-thiouridylase
MPFARPVLFPVRHHGEQLDYLRFPLADLEKPQVRGVAAELGLRIAAKPDSQDICFVPKGDYRTLIDKLRPQGREAGEIVHHGRPGAGRPRGHTDYTIGQRRGLNIGVGEPLFVTRLDPPKRQVIVGPREALLTASLTLDEDQLAGRRGLDRRGGRRRAGAGPCPLDPRRPPRRVCR